MRLLDNNKITYRVLNYKVDEEHLDAVHVAEGVGLPPGQVFKTLVARGDKTGVVVACLPGDGELDLKLLAKASGNKRVEMVALKEVLPLTGYIRGGVSPLGTKKPYPVFLAQEAKLWENIVVSAGLRGHQIMLPPDDLLRAAPAAQLADICRTDGDEV